MRGQSRQAIARRDASKRSDVYLAPLLPMWAVAVFDWVPDRVGSGTKACAQPNFPLRVFNKGRVADCNGGIRSEPSSGKGSNRSSDEWTSPIALAVAACRELERGHAGNHNGET